MKRLGVDSIGKSVDELKRDSTLSTLCEVIMTVSILPRKPSKHQV